MTEETTQRRMLLLKAISVFMLMSVDVSRCKIWIVCVVCILTKLMKNWFQMACIIDGLYYRPTKASFFNIYASFVDCVEHIRLISFALLQHVGKSYTNMWENHSLKLIMADAIKSSDTVATYCFCCPSIFFYQTL